MKRKKNLKIMQKKNQCMKNEFGIEKTLNCCMQSKFDKAREVSSASWSTI